MVWYNGKKETYQYGKGACIKMKKLPTELETLTHCGYTEDMLDQLAKWCPFYSEEKDFTTIQELLQQGNLKKLMENLRTAQLYYPITQFLVYHFQETLYGDKDVPENFVIEYSQTVFDEIEQDTPLPGSKRKRLLELIEEVYKANGAEVPGSKGKQIYSTLTCRTTWKRNAIKDALFSAKDKENKFGSSQFLMFAVMFQMPLELAELFLKKFLQRRGFQFWNLEEMIAYLCLKYHITNPLEFNRQVIQLYEHTPLQKEVRVYQDTRELVNAMEAAVLVEDKMFWDEQRLSETFKEFLREYKAQTAGKAFYWSKQIDKKTKRVSLVQSPTPVYFSKGQQEFNSIRKEIAPWLRDFATDYTQTYTAQIKVECVDTTYYYKDISKETGYMKKGERWSCAISGIQKAVNVTPIMAKHGKKDNLIGAEGTISGVLYLNLKPGEEISEGTVYTSHNGYDYKTTQRVVNRLSKEREMSVPVCCVKKTKIFSNVEKETGFVQCNRPWSTSGKNFVACNKTEMQLCPHKGRATGTIEVFCTDENLEIPKGTLFQCGNVIVRTKDHVFIEDIIRDVDCTSKKQDRVYVNLYVNAKKRLESKLLEEGKTKEDFLREYEDLIDIVTPIFNRHWIRKDDHFSKYQKQPSEVRRCDLITIAFVRECLYGTYEDCREFLEIYQKRHKYSLRNKMDYIDKDILKEVNSTLIKCGYSRLYYANRFECLMIYLMTCKNPLEKYQILWAMYAEKAGLKIDNIKE